MSKVSEVIARLQAHNAAEEAKKPIAEHNAKVEAARAAGPNAFIKKESSVARAIWRYLEPDKFKGVTFEEEHFFATEPRFEDGHVYGPYGWQPARIKFPTYGVRYTLVEVYDNYRGSWRSRSTGRYNLYVGDYGGDRKLFKELKAGGYKYYEIAAELGHRIRSEEARARAAAAVKANKTAVEEVIAGLDAEFKPYSGVSLEASADAAKPVFVKLDRSRTMTVEAATALLNVLKKFDIG